INETQTLRLGYQEATHQLCLQRDWDAVRQELKAIRKDVGAATRDTKQIRLFYESDETVLWVTFFGDLLYWCFSKPEITLLPDHSKTRPVIGQWRSTDINGHLLQKYQLSGKLTSMEGFRGTICSVKELDYLVNRINGTLSTETQEAVNALELLEQKIEPLIRGLHWKDFEILVDLIFRQAGWQRVGVLGGTEKTIDLDLLSPITSERYAVQIKSTAGLADFENYQRRFEDMQGYNRLYFVVHTPSDDLVEAEMKSTHEIELLLPAKIAHLVVKYGLADWLSTKAA
ncbi:MAG TPA: restriction endonuclease, partial [Pyrinomonadaceae bacterium]|nr:restriction endonuclease [Pyrinomonadaceae bacterium]